MTHVTRESQGSVAVLHDTRESWLKHATQLLVPILEQGGVTPAATVQVSCGWPARGALSRAKRRVGECWHHEGNKDHQSHVFVSPCLEEPVEVVGCLLHEIIHAALPLKAKHGGQFARVARACGLAGKPSATTVGEQLATRINAEILPVLGPYPHQAIDASARKPQKTRLRLWECECDPPVKARVASDHFQATCDVCEVAFVMQTPKEQEASE